MGRRSKVDLYDLTERIITLYEKDKLTIQQIADRFNEEGLEISRGSIQRALVDIKEAARAIQLGNEQARSVLEAYRDNPGTDIAEASVKVLGTKFFQAAMAIEGMDTADPLKAVMIAEKLVSSEVKISSLRLKYQNGFEAAKKAVLDSLKYELKQHPDILERLTMLVGALEPPKA
jgi:ArsR family metal-binding transcriptional regulator